jgi:hypothetical protein
MSLEEKRPYNAVRAVCVAVMALVPCCLMSGCLIAGYSSAGGGFIWPGGLGLIVVLGLLLWLLLRQR